MKVKNKETKNCVAECRVSSTKQSQEGESLEVQEATIRKYAAARDWNIVPNGKVWSTAISGRKTNREVFEEILEYIKAHPGLVDFYVFRSIDRLTRAGTGEYDRMKKELGQYGVQMVDTYGVIQPAKNTLEELGFEYEWSMQSTSEVSEAVAATNSKQEVTNILTRMIGQSIRNTQKGYRTRRPADGYKNQKIYDDEGKKKYIQVPDPERARYRVAMYELRAQGLSDIECVERVNAMGYRSPIQNKWNTAHDKIIGRKGGNPTTLKQFQRDIQNTIYAGVLCEKWTKGLPIKAQYPGLVSIELWNRANHGRVAIMENEDGSLELVRGYPKGKTGKERNKYNPLFPFKCVGCPMCSEPVRGSSPTGKLGKSHATYHCARKHKYWGVNKKTFEANIERYIKSLEFDPDLSNALELTFMNKYRQREKEVVQMSGNIHRNIADLEAEQAAKLEAYTSTKSSVIRDKLTVEIERLERDIQEAGRQRHRIQITRDDIKSFVAEAKHIMEHPAEILWQPSNPRVQALMFELVFEKMPNYLDILNGTPKLSYAFSLSSTFTTDKTQLVSPEGLDWNTLENYILRWKQLTQAIGPAYFMPSLSQTA